MSSVYIKAICGTVIHKHFSLDEGNYTEIDESLVDRVMKLWEKEGIVKIFANADDAENFKFKGITTLAAESLASLNPEVLYDRRGNEIGVAKTDPPTFDFATHRPIKVEEVVVKEVTKEVKAPVTTNAKPKASESSKTE